MKTKINWELRKTNSQNLSELISSTSKVLTNLKKNYANLLSNGKELKLVFRSMCAELKKIKSNVDQYKKDYEDKKAEWLTIFDSLDLYDCSDEAFEIVDLIESEEKMHSIKNREVIDTQAKIRKNTQESNDLLEDIRKQNTAKKQYQTEHGLCCLNHYERLEFTVLEASEFYKQFLAVSFCQLNLKKEKVTNKSEMMFLRMNGDEWKYMKLCGNRTYKEMKEIWDTIISEPPSSTKYFKLYKISEEKLDIIKKFSNPR